MAEFVDKQGTIWTVALDGLLLAELRDKCRVDIVQDGLFDIEERDDVLVRVLLLLCREQISTRGLTDHQFASLLAAETAERAIAAVRGAAADFFRPSKWSAIQSRSQQREQAHAQFLVIKPMLEMLQRPDMPAAMREVVMATIANGIEAATASQNSTDKPSASGQDSTPPNAAGGSPEF